MWRILLEVLFDGKLVLLDKNLLERIQVILFIKYQHRFLIVDGTHRAKTQGTVPISNQNGIACDASCALIAIGECLNIRK